MSNAKFNKLVREMEDREGFKGSTILISVLFLIIALIYWASKAELDNVTRGEGRIISSMQNQKVQATEGGVILKRFVQENSVVSQGDVLFEIDPIDANSELNQIMVRISALKIKETRLKAELSGIDFVIPEEISPNLSQIVDSERDLFFAKKADLQGKISVFDQRLEQQNKELEEIAASKFTSENTVELLRKEVEFIEPMVQQNIASKPRLLALQRELEAATGQIEKLKISETKTKSIIKQLKNEVESTRLSYKLASMEELNQVISEQSQRKGELPKLEERVSRTLVKSPMDGIIYKLNYRTPGGYVSKGDVLIEFVPTGQSLEIEAKIKPQDISKIMLGDDVLIRFSAYDSSKYGTVNGKVIRISPDAITDERQQIESHFLIGVGIEERLVVDGNPVQFIPGMTATIDVLSGKRTILEYFWQPIARIQELALRD
ncbi:HlyD family type I secretion periplasmic adaptor subunit [Rhodobacteraceae bacterium nBUS_24]